VNEKWWAILFGVVMLACGALYAVSSFVGWGLPPSASSHAHEIDFLYYLILAITTFFFVLTEVLLVVFMYRYGAGAPAGELRPSFYGKIFLIQPVYQLLANVFNTPKKIEMAWTIVPAVILLYLAFAQVSTWADVKYKSRLRAALEPGDQLPLHIEVNARQFEWRMRYPSRATWEAWKKNPVKAEEEWARNWAKNRNFDDIMDLPNELHVIKDRHVLVHLSTRDVIHSFNIPYMRIKQDALPGKEIPVWFKPIASNVNRVGDRGFDGDGRKPETGKPVDVKKVWEIPCAELCGWGHYRMIGRVFVHETEEDYLAWLDSAAAHQNDFGAINPKKND